MAQSSRSWFGSPAVRIRILWRSVFAFFHVQFKMIMLLRVNSGVPYWFTVAGQDHVVFNADGIYLATYVTLLLNFELGKREYYPSRSGFVAQSEVLYWFLNQWSISLTYWCFICQDDFIASVLNSGILVYLTPEFLAELYQGVLVTDVIGNAGFNVNADSNAPMSSCAFINLLTGTKKTWTRTSNINSIICFILFACFSWKKQQTKMSGKSSVLSKRLASFPTAANFTLPSHPTFCFGNLVGKQVVTFGWRLPLDRVIELLYL